MTDEIYYRPGLVFFSTHVGYQFFITPDARYHVFPDGRREIDRPMLVADFRDQSAVGSETTDNVVDGKPLVVHNSAGGVFDLDAAALRGGWNDEEKEVAARKMLQMDADPAFNDFWVAKAPEPAGKPWPTYDDTHHFKIPGLADDLGLVGEALAYEKAHKNRSGVVEGLEEKIKDAEDLSKLEEELTVA